MRYLYSLKRSFSRRSFVILAAFLVCQSFSTNTAQAQVGDTFEGALWKFKLTPKTPRQQPVVGLFRVADEKIFTMADKDDKQFTKPAGQSIWDKNRQRTKIVFEALRVREQGEGKRGTVREITGAAMLKCDEFGEGSGRFIDGDGNHWEMHVTRFKE